MTTQTEITKSTRVVQAPVQVKTPVWPMILGVALILSLIGAAILIPASKRDAPPSNARALNAWSARYQGLANQHAAEVDTKRAMQAWSARYQGQADLYAAGKVIQLDRNWSAVAERYQAMADAYLAAQDAGLAAGWSATATRYQALADYYQTRKR